LVCGVRAYILNFPPFRLALRKKGGFSGPTTERRIVGMDFKEEDIHFENINETWLQH
jgi:hypothetical protein